MNGSRADEPDGSDRLADLLFYAPLGFLWERDRVLEQLVKRGRSQSQLAKLAAQMAAQRGPEQVEGQVAGALEALARAAAGPITRVLVEVGVALGAPGATRSSPAASTGGDEEPESREPRPEQAEPTVQESTVQEPTVQEPTVPVDYETLSARELLPRLAALDAVSLAALRERELAGRGRKTVLSRIDQLLQRS